MQRVAALARRHGGAGALPNCQQQRSKLLAKLAAVGPKIADGESIVLYVHKSLHRPLTPNVSLWFYGNLNTIDLVQIVFDEFRLPAKAEENVGEPVLTT